MSANGTESAAIDAPSTDADDRTGTGTDGRSDRDAALKDLQAVRDRARYKVLGDGRIRDTERAEIRIKYMRLIVQACNAERRLLKDRDLEELEARLDRLEGDRTSEVLP